MSRNPWTQDVFLWTTGNDEYTYREAMLISAEGDEGTLREWVENALIGRDILNTPGLASDFLQGCLSRVNWYELLEDLREDNPYLEAEEDEEDEEEVEEG